jgi:hypothetical protein
MIVGGYTLDLYCDVENEQHSYREFPHQFYAQTKQECYREARRCGWTINDKTGFCYCPKCKKAKRVEVSG